MRWPHLRHFTKYRSHLSMRRKIVFQPQTGAEMMLKAGQFGTHQHFFPASSLRFFADK